MVQRSLRRFCKHGSWQRMCHSRYTRRQVSARATLPLRLAAPLKADDATFRPWCDLLRDALANLADSKR